MSHACGFDYVHTFHCILGSLPIRGAVGLLSVLYLALLCWIEQQVFMLDTLSRSEALSACSITVLVYGVLIIAKVGLLHENSSMLLPLLACQVILLNYFGIERVVTFANIYLYLNKIVSFY